MAYLWGATPPPVLLFLLVSLSSLFPSSHSRHPSLSLLPPSVFSSLSSLCCLTFCTSFPTFTFATTSSLTLNLPLPSEFICFFTFSPLFNLYSHLIFIPFHVISFQPHFIFFISLLLSLFFFRYLPPSHLHTRLLILSFSSLFLPIPHVFVTPWQFTLLLSIFSHP